jgi:tetratricopeptide (TPR) repeat protein
MSRIHLHSSGIGLRACLLVSIAALLSGLGGCASSQSKLPSQRYHSTSDDASFAAGAGRPPTAATSYALARILVGQGRDRDALYVLTRVIRESPECIPAYNEVAGIYVRADRLDDAISTLESGLKRASTDTVMLNNLGMCYFLKSDPSHALEAFARAADRDPSNPLYRGNHAAALAMVGREAEAEAEYNSLINARATRANLAILAKARDRANAAARAGSADAHPTTAPTAYAAPVDAHGGLAAAPELAPAGALPAEAAH